MRPRQVPEIEISTTRAIEHETLRIGIPTDLATISHRERASELSSEIRILPLTSPSFQGSLAALLLD